MDITAASTFAASFAALYAAHQVGDHWIQTGHQAAHKGAHNFEGKIACLSHVLTMTLTKVLFLGILSWVLGVQYSSVTFAIAVVLDAATHYWADRRFTLKWLAELTDHYHFYMLGAPRPDKDDNPSLGTGAYAMDQSFHIFWLFVASIILAL
jgi:hypothetical protein